MFSRGLGELRIAASVRIATNRELRQRSWFVGANPVVGLHPQPNERIGLWARLDLLAVVVDESEHVEIYVRPRASLIFCYGLIGGGFRFVKTVQLDVIGENMQIADWTGSYNSITS